MKKNLIILFLALISSLSFAQVTLTIEGTVENNTATGTWSGVNIPRSVPTTFTYRNNSITSVNSSGYMLQAGDEAPGSTNNKLDGEIITGNKFVWNGTDVASTITHALFVGYNINALIKYNYLYRGPTAMVLKSNGMTYAAGGVAYNIINRTGCIGIAIKGINGICVYNNTFYSDEVKWTSNSNPGTAFGLIDIFANNGLSPMVYSTGTKIKNNIFYTVHQIYNITIEEAKDLTGFESDYNIFYCEAGTPMFNYLGTAKTFAQWQALGYDIHSVVINPKFNDFTDFVPAARLDYGTNLGFTWQTGLSTNAKWIAGSSPATTDQNGTWQVGACLYSLPGACIPPTNQASQLAFSDVTNTTMTAGWTRGNGNSVLVVAHQGSDVNSIPVNGVPYTANWTFGSGSQLGEGNYVVYNGPASSANISGLKSGITYYYAIYEYSTGTNCYSIPALTGNVTTTGIGYCAAGSSDSNYGYISNVKIGSISNSSGKGTAGYEDYTSITTPMQIGVNLSAAISVTNPNSTYQILIWIDWNKDGDFADQGENVYYSNSPFVTPLTTTNISPPTGALTGRTQMRIRLHDLSSGANSTPCNNSGYGEVEDYSVDVTAACTPPTAPKAGNIIQPTCSFSQGSVVLSGLPATGTWTLIRTPGVIATTGTGTSTTITGLSTGTYYYKVINVSGCISISSSKITIKAQPVAPTAPKVGAITQPTISLATGSVVLSGLPATGSWKLIRTPGGIITSGKGASKTINGLAAGTIYTFTVTNASGCTSAASAVVVINLQPTSPPITKSLTDNTPFSKGADTYDIQTAEISIYPNPVSRLLNIEFDKADNDDYKTVNIISSTGMLIGKEKAVTPLMQLDFSGFEPGIYILEFIKSPGKVFSVKIIKKK